MFVRFRRVKEILVLMDTYLGCDWERGQFVVLVCCVQSDELPKSGAQRCFARIKRDFLVGGAVVRKCCKVFWIALVTDKS